MRKISQLEIGLKMSPPAVAGRSWRPIHYLGSKLRLAEKIQELLAQVDPKMGPVCDLFAGSGTVAARLASSRDVVAADIQEYSRVLCSAVLNPARITAAEIQRIVAEAASSEFHRDLTWAAEPLISQEQRRIALAQRGHLEPICELLESSPIILCNGGESSLKSAIGESRRRLETKGFNRGPRTITLRHFGGVYFSYLQAVQLSTLVAHAHTQRNDRKDLFLAAAMSTASEVVNTVGKQFAQPLQARNSTGAPKPHLIEKIARDRQLDSFNIFSRWLEQYGSLPTTDHSHVARRSDFITTLERDCEDVRVIYADPPYTRDHYSRYYHVLETMCLCDEPQISFARVDGQMKPLRGVYRIDRHQSPFCIKSQAPEAFEQMFSRARRLGVPLVLSYSPLPTSSKPRPRVMTIESISTLALRFFKTVDRVAVKGVTHNKLNTTKHNSEASADAELLLIFT